MSQSMLNNEMKLKTLRVPIAQKKPSGDSPSLTEPQQLFPWLCTTTKSWSSLSMTVSNWWYRLVSARK